jgi:hypothetical protein
MKKNFPILLLFVILTICCSMVSVQAVTVSFNVSDNVIEIGESFEVEISVFDGSMALGDLTGFGFDVDPLGMLTLFSYNPPPAIDPDYADVSLGGNNVSGAYIGLGNANTDVRLATLSFTAGQVPGTDTLEIEGIFDGSFFGLFYEFGDESIVGSTPITINDVPEPATVLLFGAALIGFAGFRRKIRKTMKDA